MNKQISSSFHAAIALQNSYDSLNYCKNIKRVLLSIVLWDMFFYAVISLIYIYSLQRLLSSQMPKAYAKFMWRQSKATLTSTFRDQTRNTWSNEVSTYLSICNVAKQTLKMSWISLFIAAVVLYWYCVCCTASNFNYFRKVYSIFSKEFDIFLQRILIGSIH